MDYNSLEKSIDMFNNLITHVIGRSEDDRNIYSLSAFFDCTRPWVIIQGAIHAREHLSADLIIALCNMVDVRFNYYKNEKFFPNICFVPIVNPDGVEIAYYGVNSVKNHIKRAKLLHIIGNNDFKLYKSNANGVDLNNNFDALWDRHKNADKPSMNGFIGPYVFSEKETRALAKLTLKLQPIFTISYHMKGEEIYWDFFQSGTRRSRDKKIANLLSKVTGYKVKNTEYFSSGGYKDWCVSKLKIPSLTIEVGRDNLDHPVPNLEIYNIIAKNAGILDNLCDIVKVIQGENYE